jgi:predicted ATP-binding protein involved in virulence
MAKSSKKATVRRGRSQQNDREVTPVYFLSLEVENVLCFKDLQTLGLTDERGSPAQWTVILGDNGVGKTTLLRCLAGMELDYQTIKNKEGSLQVPLLDMYTDSMEPWLSEINHNALMVDADACASVTVKLACAVILSDFTKQPAIKYDKGEIEVGIFDGCSVIVPETEGSLICYGYGAIRNLGHSSLQESFESENSLSLFSEGSPLINAEEWLLQTDYAHRTATGEIQKRIQKQFRQIEEILKRILPDVSDLRIAPADEENLPRAEFLTPYGWVHIDSLGLGYRTAIAWMVDLAVRLFRRYPNSPDPLAEPAIVLVDEIDLHLHPRWQRTIMDFLTERFPNTQFIVTAHSPLVVQAAQNANIVLLRREGDRVIIDNNPEIIENWRIDQVLTSVFELPSVRPPQLDQLLNEREQLLSKAHLTEADEARLQALAQQIGSLPTGDTPEDIEAKDIIRRAAKLLKNAG